MGLQFLTPLAPFLCVFVFARSSEGACEINGKTYKVGDTWQDIDQHSDCFHHICLEDGSHTSSKCDPTHNDVADTLVETTVSDVDLDKSLPTTELSTDNQENVSGCTVDDSLVAVGEQVEVPGKCLYRACAGNDQWIMKACALIGISPGWILTPEDVSKPYPDCCSRASPLLDIIPDVIRNLQWSVSLKLTYDNDTVDYGNKLTPSQVNEEPTVDYWADSESWFLLSMVDPDAPSRQNATSREFLHWLVGNIPGNDVSSGDVLAEYVGSGPPRGTGLHRYVFLLYKQPGNITFGEPTLGNTSVEGRRNFSISKFSENYNLSDPVSLNFFVAQYDDYVPDVHKQLGIP